jgi:uncharacterized protein YifE (UPF0438 family)
VLTTDPHGDLTQAEAEALDEGGFNLEPLDLETRSPLVQTAAELVALIEGSLSVAATAERLGISPNRVRQRLNSQPPTLYGIRLESAWVVPEFQFDGCRLLPGIAEVVSRLHPELHPLSVFRWFTTPNPDLEVEATRTVSPRDWLRFGLSIHEVADLAANI